MGSLEDYKRCNECYFEHRAPNAFPCCDCDGDNFKPAKKEKTIFDQAKEYAESVIGKVDDETIGNVMSDIMLGKTTGKSTAPEVEMLNAAQKQVAKDIKDSGSRTEFETGSDVTGIVNNAKCNTGIEIKREYFSIFADLIRNQFWHGGEKYKLGEDKEFTDAICEAFPGMSGVDWVLGTCMKYLGRYKNFGREKDLLKVATYMYLLWLKGGFHLKEVHDEDTHRDGGRTDG